MERVLAALERMCGEAGPLDYDEELLIAADPDGAVAAGLLIPDLLSLLVWVIGSAGRRSAGPAVGAATGGKRRRCGAIPNGADPRRLVFARWLVESGRLDG